MSNPLCYYFTKTMKTEQRRKRDEAERNSERSKQSRTASEPLGALASHRQDPSAPRCIPAHRNTLAVSPPLPGGSPFRHENDAPRKRDLPKPRRDLARCHPRFAEMPLSRNLGKSRQISRAGGFQASAIRKSTPGPLFARDGEGDGRYRGSGVQCRRFRDVPPFPDSLRAARRRFNPQAEDAWATPPFPAMARILLKSWL